MLQYSGFARIKRHFRRCYFILPLMLSAWPVSAQVDSAKITGLMRSNHILALGLTYIDDGRIVEQKVFGQLKAGTPAPPDAVFNVASITKTIITMVTLRLIGSGQWDLDA